MKKTVLFYFAGILLAIAAYKNIYGLDNNKTKQVTIETLQEVYKTIPVKDNGIKEISYNDFMTIRNSGEDYVLIDVRGIKYYNAGHIEGAISLPSEMINEDNAQKILKNNSKIIVYCGSFICRESSKAARKLLDLGYQNVFDYKGGVKEWKEQGNKLIES